MKIKLLLSAWIFLCLTAVNAQNNRLWATYYGGTNYDVVSCTATDASNNVYIAGYTNSSAGIASGGFDITYGGGTYDAYLAKFDTDGNRLWATYYGSTNNDYSYCIATDDAGNVYMAGGTSSQTGIATGGFQNTYGGGNYDAMLVKFDAAGNRLWATYYGGPGWEDAYGVATDPSGNVYIAGFTNSSSGIASGGFQNSYGGGTYDSYLVKFNSSGDRLWSTYYGGSGAEGYDGNSVATDTSGNVYLSGWTSSTSGIASSGFQNTLGGSSDAYLVKFDSTGSRLWATYYGGTANEGGISNILFGTNIATDISGNVYLAGTTASTSNIASGGFQNTYGGGTNDCFLVKFNNAGSLNWATYYGGSGDERGWSVATDNADNIYLTGRSNSTAGIASGGFQNTNMGNYDAFLATFSSAGSRLGATYFGGTDGEWAYSVATDALGNVYLPGFTYSTAGIASGGFQNSFAGGTYDGYLVKLTSSTMVSIAEAENAITINTFPNPFSSETTLQTNENLNDAAFILYNTLGEQLKQINNIYGSSISLQRDNLPSGIYFIRLTQGNKIIITEKIIITD